MAEIYPEFPGVKRAYFKITFGDEYEGWVKDVSLVDGAMELLKARLIKDGLVVLENGRVTLKDRTRDLCITAVEMTPEEYKDMPCFAEEEAKRSQDAC